MALAKAKGFKPDAAPGTFYVEQEQKELSACVLGANPNALARAFKDGILKTGDIEKFWLPRPQRLTQPVVPAALLTCSKVDFYHDLIQRLDKIADSVRPDQAALPPFPERFFKPPFPERIRNR